MKDLILGLAIVGVVIFGYYLMGRLDRFMRRHYKSQRIEPDPKENGIVIFDKPNARQSEEKEEETCEGSSSKEGNCCERSSGLGFL